MSLASEIFYNRMLLWIIIGILSDTREWKIICIVLAIWCLLKSFAAYAKEDAR